MACHSHGCPEYHPILDAIVGHRSGDLCSQLPAHDSGIGNIWITVFQFLLGEAGAAFSPPETPVLPIVSRRRCVLYGKGLLPLAERNDFVAWTRNQGARRRMIGENGREAPSGRGGSS